MEELADWEKPGPPKTGIDADRQEWIERIKAHLRTGMGDEVLMEAFDLLEEWMQEHPGDMVMRHFAGSLARRWTLGGRDTQELKLRLREHRAQRAQCARKDAA